MRWYGWVALSVLLGSVGYSTFWWFRHYTPMQLLVGATSNLVLAALLGGLLWLIFTSMK